MANRFKSRYRIPSARAPWWNYGNNGAYFITICTQDRFHYFGEISEYKMHLSPIGKQCWQCWSAIPDHFPFVKLGAFIVMPNHIHGIIVIDKPLTGHTNPDRNNKPPVETQNIASLQVAIQQKNGNQFGPQSKNLGSVVRGFKIGVTKFAIENNMPFNWQPRYHDHIIRNKIEFERIKNYIVKNPNNWKDDVHYL